MAKSFKADDLAIRPVFIKIIRDGVFSSKVASHHPQPYIMYENQNAYHLSARH